MDEQVVEDAQVVDEQQGQASDEVQVTKEDIHHLEQVIAQASADSALSVSRSVSESFSGLASQSGTSGVVLLDDAQFQTLTSFAGTSLHASVFSVAFLALILGAVVGVALTLHWRGSRG